MVARRDEERALADAKAEHERRRRAYVHTQVVSVLYALVSAGGVAWGIYCLGGKAQVGVEMTGARTGRSSGDTDHETSISSKEPSVRFQGACVVSAAAACGLLQALGPLLVTFMLGTGDGRYGSDSPTLMSLAATSGALSIILAMAIGSGVVAFCRMQEQARSKQPRGSGGANEKEHVA